MADNFGLSQMNMISGTSAMSADARAIAPKSTESRNSKDSFAQKLERAASKEDTRTNSAKDKEFNRTQSSRSSESKAVSSKSETSRTEASRTEPARAENIDADSARTAPTTDRVESRETRDSLQANLKKNTPAAMTQFMLQMQNELGVTPEDIISAFSKLNDSDLASSPAQSAEAFIAALGLSEEESQQAYEMYMSMLAASGVLSKAEAQSVNQKAPMNIEVKDKKSERLQALHASIDNMSGQFFNSAPNKNLSVAKPSTTAPQLKFTADEAQIASQLQTDPNALSFQESISRANIDAGLNLESAPSTEAQMTTNQMDSNLMNKQSIADGLQSAVSSKSDQLQTNTMGSEQNSAMNQQSQANQITQTQNQLNSMAYGQMVNPQGNTVKSQSAGPMSASAGDASMGMNSGTEAATGLTAADSTSAFAAAAGTEKQNDSSDNSSESQSELYSDRRADMTQNLKESVRNDNFVLNAPKPTDADMQANVREIISKAQFLAEKGGGEMKISLNPDGMGELQLKVKSVDGQINVEMITSSSESKKIIEKSLSDLKESLAAHKLNLESVKIEHGREISNQLDQKHQGDFDRQNQQQRFLNDFRERNQNMRREMFEFGTAMRPSSQTRDQAANAIYNPSAKRKAASAHSRRLDLVA